MNFRTRFFIIALLALLSTGYVSTGTARFVHQWTEHRHVDAHGIVTWAEDDDEPSLPLKNQKPDQTEHHLCPICLQLNGMGKAGLAPPIAQDNLVAFGLCAHAVRADVAEFISTPSLTTASPRGPPVV